MRPTGEEHRRAVESTYVVAVLFEDHDTATRLGPSLGLGRAAINAHLAAARDNPDFTPPPQFTDYEVLPPDGFDIRVFDQTDVWVDRLRRPHTITDRDDFTDEHLLAVLAHLRENATWWAPYLTAEEFAKEPVETPAEGTSDDENGRNDVEGADGRSSPSAFLDQRLAAPATVPKVMWARLSTTPLVRALIFEAAWRGLALDPSDQHVLVNLDRPVWFLDIDGTLSPTTPGLAGPDVATLYTGPSTSPLSVPYRRSLVRTIRRLHDSHRVEVQWLTSWGIEHREAWADAGLNPLGHADALWETRHPNAGTVTDHPNWKTMVVRDWLDEHPSGRAVWTDDDIRPDTAVDLMCTYPGRVLVVSPETSRGLADWEIALVERWVKTETETGTGQVVPRSHISQARATLNAFASELGRTVPSGVDEWLVTPTTYLDDRRPVDLLHVAPDRVIKAATAAWNLDW